MSDDRFTRPARRDTEASVLPPARTVPPRQATREERARSLAYVEEIRRQYFNRERAVLVRETLKQHEKRNQ